MLKRGAKNIFPVAISFNTGLDLRGTDMEVNTMPLPRASVGDAATRPRVVCSEFRLPCGHVVDESFLLEKRHSERIQCPHCLKFCMTGVQAARLAHPCMICFHAAQTSEDMKYHVTPCLHVFCRTCLIEYVIQKASAKPAVTCPNCGLVNHVWTAHCTECNCAMDTRALLPCPTCRDGIGFAWVQKELDVYWSLPGIYAKMDPFVQSIVASASLPMGLLRFLVVLAIVVGILFISRMF